jgi:hypothetical protein
VDPLNDPPVNKPARPRPQETTIRKLFALSSNRCAFPDCMTPIIHRKHATTLAEVCHIRAQSPDGPRFDATQTPKERHAIGNLVLMCGDHHKVIDAKENLPTYSVARLLKIKSDHESRATQDALPVLTPSAVEALLETVRAHSSPALNMDFRGAKLSAGGQGGKSGSGGGGGGVFNIVGVTPAGFPKKIDMDGKKGKWPGGGGGGGGAVGFSGRAATADDLEKGLRVTSFFMANGAEVQNGLFYSLGGGWEFYVVRAVPQRVGINLLCVIDTGRVSENSLLAFAVVVEDPSGNVVASDTFDLTIGEALRPVMSSAVPRFVSFEVSECGVWSFKLRSGDMDLARLDLEFKTPRLS